MDKDKKKDGRWLWEFSKRLVVACSIFYFLGIIYVCAAMVISEDFSAIPTLVDDLHDMLKVCIFGYFAKAGVENAIKIKLSNPEEAEAEEDNEDEE